MDKKLNDKTAGATLPTISVSSGVQFIEGARESYDGKEEDTEAENSPETEN